MSRVRTPPSSRKSNAPRRRVLVIDDEFEVTRAIQRLIRATSDATVVNDAQSGLSLILEREFDVVLCDLMMPTMNGMELHRRVADRRPDVARRIVFMTGGAFDPTMSDFLNSVPNRRLDKPFDAQELRDAVHASQE